MIKVLREGVHVDNPGEGYVNFEPICGSTALIQSGGRNILVDPGHIAWKNELNDLLRKEGLKPEDIHYVFLTHHHLDHFSNMGSFPNAKIFIGDGYVTHERPTYMVYRDIDLFELPPNFKIIPTPGHTMESNSYLLEENGVKYVCAGDAVREDVIREGAHTAMADKRLYTDSLKNIFALAEVIIPGHGRVIEGALKEELKKIVDAM